MKIQLDQSTIAYVKGSNAGSEARERMAAMPGERTHEARVAFFWLSVGMAMAQDDDLDFSDENLQALFVDGAKVHEPQRPKGFSLFFRTTGPTFPDWNDPDAPSYKDMDNWLWTEAARVIKGVGSEVKFGSTEGDVVDRDSRIIGHYELHANE